MLGLGFLREGFRDGVVGANMIGISAISSTGVAAAGFLSSRACLLRGGEFWPLLLLCLVLVLSRGAKASSQVPDVSSTLVSSRVCRVVECWIARERRAEALVWAFVIERVVMSGKWRVRSVSGLRLCWLLWRTGLWCCGEAGLWNGRGPLAPSQVKSNVCRVGWKIER